MLDGVGDALGAGDADALALGGGVGVVDALRVAEGVALVDADMLAVGDGVGSLLGVGDADGGSAQPDTLPWAIIAWMVLAGSGSTSPRMNRLRSNSPPNRALTAGSVIIAASVVVAHPPAGMFHE